MSGYSTSNHNYRGSRMPRIPGDSSYYTYALLRADGTPTEYVRKLISVTTVTRTLDQIPPEWGAKVTREAIATALDAGKRLRRKGVPAEQTLKKMLAVMGATPKQVRDAAGVRGSAVHAWIEDYLRKDLGEDYSLVVTIPVPLEGYVNAFLAWRFERDPKAVAVEVPVASFQHGFAGTLDFAWYDGEDLVLTDWKTSSAIRESAMAQVEGLAIAWAEEHPDQPIARKTVVRLGEDGTFEERESDFGPGLFLDTLSLYRRLRKKAA